MNWQKTISEFVNLIHDDKIEVVMRPVFSLNWQYLRRKFPNRIVNLERNVKYFNLEKKDFVKKEIDIAVMSDGRRGNQRMLTKSRLSSMLIPCVMVRSFIFQPKSAAKS